ncbi:MAG: hypothetical protein FD143_270 [Ignavibacteria bacterium]|nr:MAG: hypothetical protein FD143_270 [Ignavibacteria bacterium]KAF0160890.1 MAG: hypothetical protein FD188_1296 [Ignavibacteria bacterium]
MFGLYYAIIGLVSGAICSVIAYSKYRNQKDWFTLGQVLPGLSILILLFLSSKSEEKKNKIADNEISANSLVDSWV